VRKEEDVADLGFLRKSPVSNIICKRQQPSSQQYPCILTRCCSNVLLRYRLSPELVMSLDDQYHTPIPG